MTSPNFMLVSLAIVLLSWLFCRNRNKNALPLPPGPKKLPFIGNLLSIPKKCEWKTYAEWGKKYDSDIIHLNVTGKSLIILNSIKAAKDLLEKRSGIYSSRPVSTMVNDLMGWNWALAFMPYGDQWKKRRRLFQRHINKSNTAAHQPQELEYTRKMLLQTLESPEEFMLHMRYLVGAIVISTTYGIKIRTSNDPYIIMAEKATAAIGQAAIPGAFLVDVIPLLKHVPEYIPGAGFRRKAKEWRQDMMKMLQLPFDAAQKELSEGRPRPSFTSGCLGELSSTDLLEEDLELIRDVAGIVFAAGTDSTVAALNSFMLAMTCFPDIQKKAQNELDRVLHGRLPRHEDAPALPYVSAVVKELLRWKPVAPMGLPHALTRSDIYNGYHIPADSIIIFNVWYMLNDEANYPEPSVFKPERFLKDGILDPNTMDPEDITFGFGRRSCPGSHIALSTLWIAAASILSVFSISAIEGTDIDATHEYCSGVVSQPTPFKCSIKPRSKETEELIQLVSEATINYKLARTLACIGRCT